MTEAERSRSPWVSASFLSLAIPIWMGSVLGLFLWGLPTLVWSVAHLVLASTRSIGEKTHWTFVTTAWLSQLVPMVIGFATLNPIGSSIIWPAVSLIIVGIGAVVAVQLDDK